MVQVGAGSMLHTFSARGKSISPAPPVILKLHGTGGIIVSVVVVASGAVVTSAVVAVEVLWQPWQRS
jgi:hypothetical protein